jgi:hypothetical protein
MNMISRNPGGLGRGNRLACKQLMVRRMGQVSTSILFGNHWNATSGLQP